MCSRREAERRIADGRVRVDGVVQRDASRWIVPSRDRVLVDGRRVGDETERIEVDVVDRYRLQGDNFSRAIRGLEPPLLDRDDALGQARTIEALYRSVDGGGGPVDLVSVG